MNLDVYASCLPQHRHHSGKSEEFPPQGLTPWPIRPILDPMADDHATTDAPLSPMEENVARAVAHIVAGAWAKALSEAMMPALEAKIRELREKRATEAKS